MADAATEALPVPAGIGTEWFLGPDRSRIALSTGDRPLLACWRLDGSGTAAGPAPFWTRPGGTLGWRILGWADPARLTLWRRRGGRTELSVVDVAGSGTETARLELLGRPVGCRLTRSGRIEVLVALSTGTEALTLLYDPAAGSYLPLPGQTELGGVAGWDADAGLVAVNVAATADSPGVRLVGYGAGTCADLEVRWPAGIRPVAAAGHGAGIVGLTGLDPSGLMVPGVLELSHRSVHWFREHAGYSAVDVGPAVARLLAVSWDGQAYDYRVLDPAGHQVGRIPAGAGLATDLCLAADERHAIGWHQSPARAPSLESWDVGTGRAEPVCPPPEPTAAGNVRWHLREVADRDGPALPEWVFEPDRGSAAGTVVLLHGGPRGQLNQAYDPLVAALVEAGWRVVGPNYPGSSGYGAEYREATRGDWGGPDAAAIERRIRSLHAAAGGAPLCLFGQSYGGYLALLVAARLPELLDGVAVWAPVTDLTQLWATATGERRRWLEAELGPLRSDPVLLRQRSPVSQVSGLSGNRLLIGHGGRDDRCPVEQSRLLVDLLGRRSNGGSVRYLEDPDGSHAPSDWLSWVEAVRTHFGSAGARRTHAAMVHSG